MESQGNTNKFSRNHYVPPGKETTIHGSTYRFQEGDAADGNSFVPFGPCRSNRQFPSSETQHGIINTGTGAHQHEQKEEDLATRLSPSSLRPVSFK